MSPTFKFIITGIVFASLWASAAIAAKFGLRSVEPLVLFCIRFLVAGILLLGYAYGWEKQPLPSRKAWKHLVVFSLLNTAVYLGLFVFAMKYVAAGIGSLATATNPLFIAVMAAFWAGRPLGNRDWVSLGLGLTGIGIAAFPLLQHQDTTAVGLALLGLSMVSYSIGTVYYSYIGWSLSRTAINGWQVLLGGLFLLPFAVLFHQPDSHNQFDFTAWASIAWLVLPVSVVSVQLWLQLLRIDAVKASFFLFLCPVFGFFYASFLLNEPFTVYTLGGTALVLVGLYVGQRPAGSKRRWQ